MLSKTPGQLHVRAFLAALRQLISTVWVRVDGLADVHRVCAQFNTTSKTFVSELQAKINALLS